MTHLVVGWVAFRGASVGECPTVRPRLKISGARRPLSRRPRAATYAEVGPSLVVDTAWCCQWATNPPNRSSARAARSEQLDPDPSAWLPRVKLINTDEIIDLLLCQLLGR